MDRTPRDRYGDYIDTFSSLPGKRVLADLIRFCHGDLTTAVMSDVDGKIDPYYTVLNEGKRQVLLYIRQYMKEPPVHADHADDGGGPL